jgi:hypothetical protein
MSARILNVYCSQPSSVSKGLHPKILPLRIHHNANMKTSQAFTVLTAIFSTAYAFATPSFGTNGIQIVDHGDGTFGEPVSTLSMLLLFLMETNMPSSVRHSYLNLSIHLRMEDYANKDVQ